MPPTELLSYGTIWRSQSDLGRKGCVWSGWMMARPQQDSIAPRKLDTESCLSYVKVSAVSRGQTSAILFNAAIFNLIIYTGLVNVFRFFLYLFLALFVKMTCPQDQIGKLDENRIIGYPLSIYERGKLTSIFERFPFWENKRKFAVFFIFFFFEIPL